MSAPNPGRQSPPPERQSGSQQQDPVAAGKAAPEYRGDPTRSRRESEEFKNTRLESNPTHRLEELEAQKYENVRSWFGGFVLLGYMDVFMYV